LLFFTLLQVCPKNTLLRTNTDINLIIKLKKKKGKKKE